MYLEAGLFRTAIVIATGDSSETGIGILLIELFAALTACGVLADGSLLEGSDLGRVGGRFVRILHRGISMGGCRLVGLQVVWERVRPSPFFFCHRSALSQE